MFRSPAPIFKAKSIAVVGASDRANWPSIIWSNLKTHGFPGTLYPVNPRRDEVFGERCYPDLAALPGPVDLALVIVPAPAVHDVLETGVKSGLKAAVVYAGHLGEGTDPEVVARGAALRALIDDSGLTVSGPNCMGPMAVREKLFCYPNRRISAHPPGPVAAVFQSGGTMQFWVQTAQERGMRFSYAVSSGNEIGIDLADYIDYFVDDPETRQIVLFIEGVRRPEVFKAACARALEAGKPIFAIKTGRTARSREAAQSHTGAIGGDYEAFAAMCERYGIIHCPTLDHMTEAVLAFQQGRLPRGPCIGFVTTSGGTVDLLYDYCDDARAVMPPFADKTVARLQPLIPDEMTPVNPLDAGIPTSTKVLAGLCEAVLDDPSVDMLAVAGQISKGRANIEAGQPLKALLEYSDKPIIGFGRMRYGVDEDSAAYQDAIGIYYLQGLPETVAALNALAFYAARKGRAVPELPDAKGKAEALEGEAFEALLAAHGVTPPPARLAPTPEAAAEAADAIGYPVALKIVAPAFSHKTEVGGVLLGLDSAERVAAGAKELRARIEAVDKNAEITGFLVQKMVEGVEMIVGCRTDPIYGPVILLGTGGVMVELMRDAAMRLLPVGEDDVRAMLAELKGAKLLTGFRGSEEADAEALVRAVVGLGDVYLDHRHLLADLEVNPLIVREKGAGVAAVDVRPIRREAP